jgi:chromosome segregation ATPase
MSRHDGAVESLLTQMSEIEKQRRHLIITIQETQSTSSHLDESMKAKLAELEEFTRRNADLQRELPLLRDDLSRLASDHQLALKRLERIQDEEPVLTSHAHEKSSTALDELAFWKGQKSLNDQLEAYEGWFVDSTLIHCRQRIDDLNSELSILKAKESGLRRMLSEYSVANKDSKRTNPPPQTSLAPMVDEVTLRIQVQEAESSLEAEHKTHARAMESAQKELNDINEQYSNLKALIQQCEATAAAMVSVAEKTTVSLRATTCPRCLQLS